MSAGGAPDGARHLIWLYPDAIASKLDAATWLATTRELRTLGWKVTLVAMGRSGDQLISGVQAHCIPRPRIYLLGQVFYHLGAIRFLIQQWQGLDVILFHQMSMPWVLPLKLVRILMRRARPLLVMDTRTLPMSERTPRDRNRARLHRLAQWLANRWADGQTAITWHMAEAVGIPPDRLWGVWPSGVDAAAFAGARPAREWPGSQGPIHLGYIGVLHWERNLEALCQAVERANAEGKSFVLRLVGDGPARANLEQLARQSKGRIGVLSPVPHERVPDFLAWAHVGVVPHPDEQKMRVSSCIKLFEYMAAGLPPLVTRIVAHTDVVGDGDYAFWAEDGSIDGLLAGLRLVWDDRDSLRHRGDTAAAAVHLWTWAESARKLSRALELGISRFTA